MSIGFKFDKARSFFDRKAVLKRVDRARRHVLSKFGGYVRKTARRSITKAPYITRKPRGQKRVDFRTKISRPGRPPYSRTGLLKKLIFFGYDPRRDSVVIGPEPLNQKTGDAPEALEYGGTSTVVEGPKDNRRKRRVQIKARPYMGPAFLKAQAKLPPLWRDSVR